jgi:dTDP-4-amino-4,6-dideoxygalactose transaminase
LLSGFAVKRIDMKDSLDQFAIFGGKPAFKEKLHVGRPNIGDRQRLLERIANILDRRWLTNNGPYVQEFEQAIANLAGVKHCIAVCNATVGMEIAIRALRLSGEVIVPSMTFIATAHALKWQGITPVFCDIEPESLCIDPRQVERLITPRTTGIIGVHLFGRACDVAALQEIAAQKRLNLLFDAAHAFGCSTMGQMVGNFGDAEVFSFHATKFVNSFEGGAIVTNDDELAATIRLMRNFGFADIDNVVSIGTNGKMHEVSAAMGLTSLESLDLVVQTNRRNYRAYVDGLNQVAGITLHLYDDSERCNYQWIVLSARSEETGLTREQLVDILWSENVLARRYYYPGCHRMEPYRSHFPQGNLTVPVTERIVEEILCLPTGTAVHVDDIQEICQIIYLAVSNADRVRKRLSSAEIA